MGRTVDSIPFYNENHILIASYNVYMHTLYWGKFATEEDRKTVYKKLEKKKYKGFAERESKPLATLDELPPEYTITIDSGDEEEYEKELAILGESDTEKQVEEQPKKRKRRTKAEIEADNKKAEAKKQKAEGAKKKKKGTK